MPATALVLPPQPVPVIDAGGLVSLPWRSSLQNALNNLQAQITALAALEGDTTALETALAALQGEVDAAEASIAAHIADTTNPHATTAAQVGADPVGTAAVAVAAHEAAPDPHPQYLTEAEGDAAYDAIGAAAAAQAASQPLDATLTALAGQNWALNALPIGTGADTVSQVAFAANTFPARASAGDLVAKAITDDALLLLADADVPRLGTPNSWTSLQTVNANASPGSVPAPQAGTLVHVAQADATTCRAQFNAWGNFVQVQGVRANGTVGTPTALANPDNIAAFAAFGHDGTGYVTTPRANFVFQANGAWTGTSHGTRWVLQLTPSGSTTLNAVLTATSNQFFPNVDNAVSLGIGAGRWSEVFAAIGAINTSDAREKTPVRPFTDAELAAALALSDEVGFFRFISSVERKGRAAREHCGQTVQRAIEVMRKHGLDPFRYGFICHDRWDEQPETRDQETGEITQEYRAAGDRYSFRPDQLDRFIAKGIRENQKRIEARLAALEGK